MAVDRIRAMRMSTALMMTSCTRSVATVEVTGVMVELSSSRYWLPSPLVTSLA